MISFRNYQFYFIILSCIYFEHNVLGNVKKLQHVFTVVNNPKPNFLLLFY